MSLIDDIKNKLSEEKRFKADVANEHRMDRARDVFNETLRSIDLLAELIQMDSESGGGRLQKEAANEVICVSSGDGPLGVVEMRISILGEITGCKFHGSKLPPKVPQ